MDTNEQIHDLYTKHHEGGDKFDYFMCSVSGALVAYIGQTFDPDKLNNQSVVLTLIALILFVISFCIGVCKIRCMIAITKVNQEILTKQDWISKMNKGLAKWDANPTVTKTHGLKTNLGKEFNKREDFENEIANAGSAISHLEPYRENLFQKGAKILNYREKVLVVGFAFIIFAKFVQWHPLICCK